MEFKVYHCEECGNLMVKAVDGSEALVCCGQDMKLLEADTVDEAKEKHVPEVSIDGDVVNIVVGSVEHPMEDKHYITNIFAVQEGKAQIAYLKPGDEPKSSFKVEEVPVTVYEFCNLHGLWKAEA